ncbi:hypothetical protein HBI44_105080 [Parastagonospora nodorum]|nr:hypothetical protein HBI44_105080 [Parastagonospora nodorum]
MLPVIIHMMNYVHKTHRLAHRESGVQPEQPEPKRPKNLLRRLSSGFSSILPTITWRKGKSKKHHKRSTTAPVLGRGFTYSVPRDNSRLPVSQQIPAPQVDIPQLSEPEYRSYNPDTNHSFPSIEQRRCDFCGSCPPSSAISAFSAADTPCIHCQTRSPFSYLATPQGQTRSASANPNTLVQLIANSPAPEQGPRLVPPSTALNRLNNPPGTYSLPHSRTPSHARLLPSSSPSRSSSGSRPKSPRLHHLSLLPGAQAHPYVHRREVDAHLAAISAGAPSPLQSSIDEAQRAEATRSEYQDFSRTVFYGTTTTSARVWRAESGEVRREVRVQGRVHVQDERGSQGETEAAPIVNGMRLELRGGSGGPRLRGGGGPSFGAECGLEALEHEAMPVPCLRGGAGDRVRIPHTLYWLAGGTGRPVTVSSWNKDKGKKRQGGLLGRVMYGARSGQEYGYCEEDIRGSDGSMKSGKATFGSGSVRGVPVQEQVPVTAEQAVPAVVPLPETPAGEVREAEVQGEVAEEAVQENAGQAARGENVGDAARS